MDMKALDAGGTIRLARLTFNSSRNIIEDRPLVENAQLAFPVADATMVAVLSGVQTTVKQPYSCVLAAIGNVGARAGFAGQAAIPNVGTITLQGPAGQSLELQRLRFYSTEAPSDQAPYFTGGPWSLSATGGTDIGPFRRDFTLPPQFKFGNLSSTTTVPSDGYTLRWNGSGFGPGDIANITISAPGASNYAYCIVPAWMGQIAIPDTVLANFKGEQASFYTSVYSTPEARQMFTIPANTGDIRGHVEYYVSERIVARVE